MDRPTVTCPSCGQSVAHGPFCQSCGKPLQNPCHVCGSIGDVGMPFCMRCGATFGIDPTTATLMRPYHAQLPNQRNHRKSSAGQMGVVLALIAVIGFGFRFTGGAVGEFTSFGNDSSDQREMAQAIMTRDAVYTATAAVLPTKTPRPTRTPTLGPTATPTPRPIPTINESVFYDPYRITRLLHKKSVVLTENPGDEPCLRSRSDEPPDGVYAEIELRCQWGSIVYLVFESESEPLSVVQQWDDGYGWYLPDYPDYYAAVRYDVDLCSFAVAIGNVLVIGRTDDETLDDSGWRGVIGDIEIGAGILAHYGVMRLDRLGGLPEASAPTF
jgi:hypothetical protein